MNNKLLSQAEISMFCGSLGTMLRAGFSLDRALTVFSEDTETAAGRAARAMLEPLERGCGFAAAAAAAEAFPAYALGIFKTAESTGRLDEALERMAEYYERQYEISVKVKNILAYPVVLMLIMCGILSVLTFKVLPVFERVYERMTGGIAASAYSYVDSAVTVSRFSLAAVIFVGALLLALSIMVHIPGARDKLRRPAEKFVITRRALRLSALSELMDTLAMLISSGMDEDSALEQAIGLTDHSELRAQLKNCLEMQRDGMSLAQSFNGTVLTGLYGRMLIGGAESGSLDRTLAELSRRIGDEAAETMDGIVDSTEPVLIGFLTVAVGMTLLSVMLPLLGILGAV